PHAAAKLCPSTLWLSLYWCADRQSLLSFPTRRSSDLTMPMIEHPIGVLVGVLVGVAVLVGVGWVVGELIGGTVGVGVRVPVAVRVGGHAAVLQSRFAAVCRLLLEDIHFGFSHCVVVAR